MTEHPRGDPGNAGEVSYWPDHWAPMTWHRCIVEGCDTRVDPWAHVTRCPDHQAAENAKRARVHAIVQANREAGRRDLERQRA